MLIAYGLLLFSMLAEAAQQVMMDKFGEKYLVTKTDNFIFQLISGVGCFVVMLVCGGKFTTASPFMLILALALAIVAATSCFTRLYCYSIGPMSYSVLIICIGGMIISTVYGTVSKLLLTGEFNISVFQIIGFLAIIASITLGVNLQKGSGMTPKWLIITVVASIFNGSYGICQTIQQESDFKEDFVSFLLWTFLFETVIFVILTAFSAITSKGDEKKIYFNPLKTKFTFLVFLTGLIYGIINVLNIYLIGILPAIIFFPIQNGGVLFFAAIAAVVICKEKMTKKQVIGLIIGIAAVVLLNL